MAWNPNVPTVTNRVQDDLNAIRENFQHLDQSRIVEMGFNINGTYVRWENGLQICYVRDIAFVGDGTSEVKTGIWTHPAAFVSNPAIVGRNAPELATPTWYLEVNPGTDTSRTNVFWRAYRASGSWGSGLGYPMHYIAIGRWK